MMSTFCYLIIGILLFELCNVLIFRNDKKKAKTGILIGFVGLILLLIYEYVGG